MAEDIAQEAFLKLWKNRGRIAQAKNIRPYLFSLTKNLMIDYFRRMKIPSKSFILDKEVPAEKVVDVHSDGYLRKFEIEDAIAKLPEELRRVVEGNIIGSMTATELAIELGRTPSAIRGMKIQAIRKLIDQLK